MSQSSRPESPIVDAALQRELRAQRAEGKLHSRGAFWLDLARARDKLAEFGLDGPERGLLRLIQLGIASDVQSMEIAQGRDNVRLSFLGGKRFSVDPHSAPEPVRIALLSLLHHGFDYADLSHAGKRHHLSLSGVELVDGTSLAQVTTALLHRRLSGSFWDRWRQSLRARLVDSNVLLERLRFSPVQIKLDAQPKPERSWPRPRFVFVTRLLATRGLSRHGVRLELPVGDNAHLFHDSVPEQRHEVLREPFWGTFVESHQRSEPRHFDASRPEWSGKVSKDAPLAHLWLALSGSKEPGRLIYVRDGITVGERKFPGGAAVHGVVSALGLDTDISGLRVVENGKLEALEWYLKEMVRRDVVRVRGLDPPRSVLQRLAAAGV